MTRYVFLDTEMSSIHPEHRKIWDIAAIVRDATGPDREHQWFLDIDLTDSDPFSLDVGKYYQRHPNPYRRDDMRYSLADPHVTDEFEVLIDLSMLLKDAFVVGAVPWFDMETLARDLRSWGLTTTHHYHLVDIEAMAAGALGIPPPWDFDKVLSAFGLAQGDDRHSALGDARLVRDLYDKVIGRE